MTKEIVLFTGSLANYDSKLKAKHLGLVHGADEGLDRRLGVRPGDTLDDITENATRCLKENAKEKGATHVFNIKYVVNELNVIASGDAYLLKT